MSSFLESDRLLFRAPIVEDAECICSLLNDKGVRRYLVNHHFPMTIEGEKEWIKNLTSDNQRPIQVFVISSKEPIGTLPKKFIGITGLHNIDWIARSAEWGIMLDESVWGKKLGQEIAARILKWAFDDLNLMRVQLRVHAENVAGIKCYERAGFVKEGVLRRAVYTDGIVSDMIIMSVIRDDL